MMLFLRLLHCRRTRLALWDYAGERLPEEALEKVERHLAVCTRCRREAAAFRRSHGLLDAIQQAPVPTPRSDWNALRSRLQTETWTPPAAHSRTAGWSGHQLQLSTRLSRRIYVLGASSLAVLILLAAVGANTLVGMFTLHSSSGHPISIATVARPNTVAAVKTSGSQDSNMIVKNHPVIANRNYPPSSTSSRVLPEPKYPIHENSVHNYIAATVGSGNHESESRRHEIVVAAIPRTERNRTHSDHMFKGDKRPRRLQSNRETPGNNEEPKFRPYTPKPGDAIRPDGSDELRDQSEIQQVASSAYIMPPLRPVQQDTGDRPF